MTLKQDRAAKKRERLKQDKAWAEAVKERAGYRCERCGKSEHLNAHHAYGRRSHPSVRHDLENGVCLCAGCHLWWAHKEVLEFGDWFRKKLGKQRYEALRRRANEVAK